MPKDQKAMMGVVKSMVQNQCKDKDLKMSLKLNPNDGTDLFIEIFAGENKIGGSIIDPVACFYERTVQKTCVEALRKTFKKYYGKVTVSE